MLQQPWKSLVSAAAPRAPATRILPGLGITALVAVNEVIVAHHDPERSVWGWVALWVAPVAAARLSMRRGRSPAPLAIGAWFLAGLLLADVMLSVLGWNAGKPAGWDLLDSDPAAHIILEALACIAWAALMAWLAMVALRRPRAVRGAPAWLGAGAFGALVVLCCLPAFLFTILRGTPPPARITTLAVPPATRPEHPAAPAGVDQAGTLVTVDYFDPGLAGTLQLEVRVRGHWYAARARLGAAAQPGADPHERSLQIAIPAGVRRADIARLRLRVWPRAAEPYIEDLRVDGSADASGAVVGAAGRDRSR